MAVKAVRAMRYLGEMRGRYKYACGNMLSLVQMSMVLQ